MPERIQLRRTKGWRKPEGAVIVARPSRWGNWYVARPNRVFVGRGVPLRNGHLWIVVHTNKYGHETGAHWGTWADKANALAFAVELYRRSLEASYVEVDGPLHRRFYLDGLAGNDLACWCPLEDEQGHRVPCHADVLLELANGTTT